MPSVSADVDTRLRRLRDHLLDLLRKASLPAWPGCDGLTVEEVLLTYPSAATAGLVPDLDALLCEHPDLHDALRALFAAAPHCCPDRQKK
jgi:hypothetical protein